MTKLHDPKDLILELRSDQIPVALQQWGRKWIGEALQQRLAVGFAGTSFQIHSYSTPCRLVFHIEGLPKAITLPATKVKGPLVSRGAVALQGFLKKQLAAGTRGALSLVGVNEADYLQQAGSGDRIYHYLHLPAWQVKTTAVLEELLPEVLHQIKWPERMAWRNGGLQWVRPLRAVVAVFDSKPLKFRFGHLGSQSTSCGRIWDEKEHFVVTDFASYQQALVARQVILDHKQRRKIIERELATIGVTDAPSALLDEVAGLVARPWVLACQFDKTYLDLPSSLIQAVLMKHQRAFICPERTGEFAIVAEWHEAQSESAVNIRKGNEAAVNARLEDARFSWNNDCRQMETGLAEMQSKLQALVLHPKLKTAAVDGSFYGKMLRTCQVVASTLAEYYWNLDSHGSSRLSDEELFGRSEVLCGLVASFLAKLDLVTETVREFPSLQGYVISELFKKMMKLGSEEQQRATRAHLAQLVSHAYLQRAPRHLDADSHFAERLRDGLEKVLRRKECQTQIILALASQYWPADYSSNALSNDLGRVLATADRADTMLSLLLVCDKPTGARDPYALRQQAGALVALVMDDTDSTKASEHLSGRSYILRRSLDSSSSLVVQQLAEDLYRQHFTELVRDNLSDLGGVEAYLQSLCFATDQEGIAGTGICWYQLWHAQESKPVTEQIRQDLQRYLASKTSSSSAKAKSEQQVQRDKQQNDELVTEILQRRRALQTELKKTLERIMPPFYELLYHQAARRQDWIFNSLWLYEGQVGVGLAASDQQMGLLDLTKVEHYWRALLEHELRSDEFSDEEALPFVSSYRRLFSLPLDEQHFADDAEQQDDNWTGAESFYRRIYALLGKYYVSKYGTEAYHILSQPRASAAAGSSGEYPVIEDAQDESSRQLVNYLQENASIRPQQDPEKQLLALILFLNDPISKHGSRLAALIACGHAATRCYLLQQIRISVDIFLDQVHINSGTDAEKKRWTGLLLLARQVFINLALPFGVYRLPSNCRTELSLHRPTGDRIMQQNYLHPRVARSATDFIRYLDKFTAGYARQHLGDQA